MSVTGGKLYEEKWSRKWGIRIWVRKGFPRKRAQIGRTWTKAMWLSGSVLEDSQCTRPQAEARKAEQEGLGESEGMDGREEKATLRLEPWGLPATAKALALRLGRWRFVLILWAEKGHDVICIWTRPCWLLVQVRDFVTGTPVVMQRWLEGVRYLPWSQQGFQGGYNVQCAGWVGVTCNCKDRAALNSGVEDDREGRGFVFICLFHWGLGGMIKFPWWLQGKGQRSTGFCHSCALTTSPSGIADLSNVSQPWSSGLFLGELLGSGPGCWEAWTSCRRVPVGLELPAGRDAQGWVFLPGVTPVLLSTRHCHSLLIPARLVSLLEALAGHPQNLWLSLSFPEQHSLLW